MTSKAALLGAPRDWAIDIAVATAVGAFLGVVGPYGSFFNGPLVVRLAYWITAMWIGVALFGVCVRLALEMGRRSGLPAWFMAAVAALVGAAIQTLIVSRIAVWLWPRLASFTMMTWFGQCLAISIPLVAGYLLMRPRLLPPVEAAPSVAPETPAVAGPVVCLSMEDHYVRVHTATGSRLVAGPLERVVAGLGGQEGMRVHRSWWVARAAVVDVASQGRNLRLRLSNGVTAPVSRASVARLRAAGWLPEAAALEN
ncbi:MAG: LytTR family transcriptional regulator DNA-binding domain-containing protein [Caulobacter sp.]|nr:LytTR family transcriptional regulator DNA-binding domain-containing protein [Caulobacter sp.]